MARMADAMQGTAPDGWFFHRTQEPSSLRIAPR
jgi:hypothetical protein